MSTETSVHGDRQRETIRLRLFITLVDTGHHQIQSHSDSRADLHAIRAFERPIPDLVTRYI